MIRLDHATINTSDLGASIAFYAHFLNLKPGWRPGFDVGGAWLYPEGGDYAIVHLLERRRADDRGSFDHIAFRAQDLPAYLEKLKAADVWYAATPVPETDLVQLHHYDPNNVLIEITFEGETIATSEIRT